jgi:hypothetical protein
MNKPYSSLWLFGYHDKTLKSLGDLYNFKLGSFAP